jgi:hypothetical protein
MILVLKYILKKQGAFGDGGKYLLARCDCGSKLSVSDKLGEIVV